MLPFIHLHKTQYHSYKNSFHYLCLKANRLGFCGRLDSHSFSSHMKIDYVSIFAQVKLRTHYFSYFFMTLTFENWPFLFCKIRRKTLYSLNLLRKLLVESLTFCAIHILNTFLGSYVNKWYITNNRIKGRKYISFIDNSIWALFCILLFVVS